MGGREGADQGRPGPAGRGRGGAGQGRPATDMRTWAILLGASVLSAGCTTLSLERNTLRQAGSLTDLRYREVMENFARIAANPTYLPSYSSIYAGTTDITGVAQVAGDSFWTRAFTKAPFTATTFSQDLDVQASRAIKQN